MNKKIVFFHLLNNYSGSPMVLKNVIETVVEEGYEVDLYTSSTNGFLSGIKGVNYFDNYYNRNSNRVLTLLSFIMSQSLLFFKVLLKYRGGNQIFYINTILPFGSILAGRILGKRTISHIHEYEISPKTLSDFLFWVVNKFADEIIVVSEFLKSSPSLKIRKDIKVLYNCVSKDFEMKSNPKDRPNGKFHGLMLSSLRPYKGIKEFIKVGELLPEITFTLVVSDSQEDLERYLKGVSLPPNIKILPHQQDVHFYFKNSDLILNLTDKERCIETFGLTILEGMYYGIPSIVPTVGGVTELVMDGQNGYQIDSTNVQKIADMIDAISKDREKWIQMSKHAQRQKEKFSRNAFHENLMNILSI